MATQTVETTTRLAPFQEEFLTDIFTSAENLFKPVSEGGQGLTMPFAAQQLAGLSPEQLRALELAGQGIGGFEQFMDEGLAGIRSGQLTTDAGVGQTLLGAETQAGALETLGRAAAPGGGLGALAGQEAQIGEDQSRTGATVGALGGQQAQLGQGIASLGFQGQQAGVQDINTLLGLGGLQQQQAQQEFNIARQNELARQQIPFQQISYQSDIFRGVPALQQQATTTQTPDPSTSSQILGLGIAGLGAAGMAGGFGNLFGRP